MSLNAARFIDIIRDVSAGNAKLPQSEYQSSGNLAVVDQGQNFIAGYTDEMTYQFRSESLPVVVFGDHTKAVKYIDFPFVMGADGVKVLKPSDSCDPKYFYHFLKQAKIPDAGYSRHFKFLKELSIPLPPLPEQRRIAAILDKADALRAKRREAIAKLDQLLQSVFLEMFGDPVTNPKNWPSACLSDLIEFSTGKLDSNAAEEDGDYPFFTCARTPSRINTYAFDCEALLLAGNNAAGQYWVKYYSGKFNAYQRTYILRLKNKSCTYLYMKQALQSRLLDLQRMSKGSSTKYLTLSILKPMHIPVAPIEVQRSYSEFYVKLQSLLNDQYRSLAHLDSLFGTAQDQAFAGTL